MQGLSVFDEIDQEEKSKSKATVKPVTSAVATPALAGNVFDQIHAEANPTAATPVTAATPIYPKSPTPWRDAIEQGITDAGDALVKLPGQIYHAATDTPKPDELGTPMGPVGLAVKRLVVDPSADNIKDFLTKFKSDPTGLKPESHVALLKAIPILGPMFAPLGSALENGDYKGAAREASNLLTQGAVAEVGGEAIGAGKNAVSNSIDNYVARSGKADIHAAAHPESFQPASDAVGKGFLKGGATQADFDSVNKVFDAAAKPLQDAAQQYLGSNAKIENVRDLTHVGDQILPEIYNNEILKPAAKIQPVNLADYADKLIADLPKNFSPDELARASQVIRKNFTGTYTGPQLAAKLKQFNSANRVNLALNSYEQSAVDALPIGHVLNMETNAVRDILSDAVSKVDPNADIKGALAKYGNVTDLVQRAKGDISLTPDLLDLFTQHSYITGTSPNLIGRAVQTLTSHWTSNDAYIAKAFNKYTGPVVRPEAPYSVVAPQTPLALPPAGEGPVSQTQGTNYMYARGAGPNALRDITSASPLGETGFDATRVPPAPPQKLLGSAPLQPVEGEIITPEEWAARFQGKPMPEVTSSTRLDTKALYGGPNKSLPAAPFKFTMPGQPPVEIKIGESAQPANRVLTSSSDLHGPMANQYPPNWQLDSTPAPNRSVTVDGRQVTTNAGGPGNLITTDPKVVESTVAQYDQLIKDAGKVKTTAGKTRMAELQSQRDNLVRQLIEYNKQRQAGAVR